MKIHHVPLPALSYPMLRVLLESYLEYWQEITGDDIYVVDRRVKEAAEHLADIFTELSRRI